MISYFIILIKVNILFLVSFFPLCITILFSKLLFSKKVTGASAGRSVSSRKNNNFLSKYFHYNRGWALIFKINIIMIKITFISFFLFLTFIGKAQTTPKVNINELVSDFIKTQKIDTAFTYENYSVGGITLVEPSLNADIEECITDLTNHPIYIFWKDEGKTYFTKITYCFEYSKIIIANDAFWEIYFSNKTIIKHEKVKPFEYITIKNSKKTKQQITISSSSFQKLQIITNGEKTEKRFDKFDLQKQSEGAININYENNINLRSKKIIDIMEAIVNEAEKNNIFKKIKSR
ncbi:hypothetical protein [Flavobacterium hydatis]|uniref:hypothetical protein n=1 Tax=Flavobacterium hydatis TaxID=991 RepID=UPI00103C2476